MGGIISKQGAFPQDAHELIENDMNPLVEEHIFGKIIYTNFSTSRRRVGYAKGDLTGALAVTDRRIVTYAFGKQQLNLSFDDRRASQMKFSVAEDDTIHNAKSPPLFLSIKADASFFNPDYKGEIEIRWRAQHASEICARIQSGIKKAQT